MNSHNSHTFTPVDLNVTRKQAFVEKNMEIGVYCRSEIQVTESSNWCEGNPNRKKDSRILTVPLQKYKTFYNVC